MYNEDTMSISASPKPEQFETKPLDKARAVVTKSTAVFFKNPLHYIFFTGLAGLVIGLMFGVKFRPELYAILLILAVVQFIRFIYRDKISPPSDQ